MNIDRELWRRSGIAGGIAPLATIVWSFALPVVVAEAGDPVDGFTEPYRTVEIASAEIGIISNIHVREGERVKQGQPLVRLDQDVLAAQLAIAKKAMESRGVLESALGELRLRHRRLEKLRELQAKGHAGKSEVDRATTDYEIADAQVLSVREQLEIKRLEYEKVRAQIERRTIRAPTNGVIASIYKNEGEYVAPTEPFVMSLVQLDPMLAVFSVSSQQRQAFRRREKVEVQLAIAGEDDIDWTSVEGLVEFVSPITDAESGTVLVKVKIPNPKRNYRSGEKCTLQVPAPDARTRFTGAR